MQRQPVPISLQEHAAPDSGFDVALVREAAQHLDPLVLFNRAFEILGDKGRLIVHGEFEPGPGEPGSERRPLADHLIAQAERCGFSLTRRLAISDQAAPTPASLRQMLAEHHFAILTLGDVDDTPVADLMDQTLVELYRSDQDGDHLFLEFERGDPPRWRITAMRPQDAPAIRELFATVFDHEISPAFWEWKYAHGRGEAILAWRDDQLIAHYGGVARDFVVRGTLIPAIAPCDVMVRPSDQGGRRGPFFLTTATFLERFVSNQGPYRLAFGFPNARARRVGELLGFYGDPVASVTEITWSSRSLGFNPQVKTTRIGPDDAHDDLDRVWEQMQNDLADDIVGVRDSQFIQYRYLQHPEIRYDVYLVQHRRGETLGAIVLKPEAKHCLLMDVVGPMRHIPVLIAQARRAAGRLGKRRLRMWITEPYAQRFQGTGGAFNPLDVAIPSNAWTSGPSLESLRDAWWLTAGDTDFL